MTAVHASADKPGRPALHLTARSGWVNDPHGLTYHNGRYHLFYQHIPGSTRWREDCTWGHASSSDLASWTEHPPALTPGDGDLGCWSGGLCTPTDQPAVIFYTSADKPQQDLASVRVARPRDDTWISWDKGPVVVTPPPGHDLRAFRDPTVFWDRSVWRMIVGAGYADGTAAVLSFSSADLNEWTFDGVAAQRHVGEQQPIWTGQVWECPQLVAIGDRHVLIVSVWADGEGHYVAAAVGSYRDGTFNAERWTRLTHGHTDHYAASAFIDSNGRPGLTFWIRGIGDHAAGWMGAISIPYRISLVDGNVSLTPHPDIRRSHPEMVGVLGLDWTPSADKPTDQLSIRSASGQTLATLETSSNLLTVSSPGGVVQLPLGPGPVHVLADGPVLEICTGPSLAALPIESTSSRPLAIDHPNVTIWLATLRLSKSLMQ